MVLEFVWYLGIEPRASSMLGAYSTSGLYTHLDKLLNCFLLCLFINIVLTVKLEGPNF